MVKRKGMGIGMGKGYKNIVLKDPLIHGLSAKGIKTMNGVKQVINLKTMPNRYSDAQDKNLRKEQIFMSKVRNSGKKGEWGFDLTDFPDDESFKDFLNRHNFVLVQRMKAPYSTGFGHYMYENPDGFKMLTEHNPLSKDRDETFLGYVGITFPIEKKVKFMEVIKDFRKSAGYKPNKKVPIDVDQKPSDYLKGEQTGYIKEEEPNESGFIGNKWLFE